MVTKRSLFYWIKQSNIKLQILLVVIILVTVAARVFPLEMQKRIVNEAISLKRLDLLYMYCAGFIGSVLLASLLKYAINVIQTYIGEVALARMRRELYAHVMTLPLSFFRKSSPGTVIACIVQELSSAGEFVGQAVAVPVTNVLTLLAFGGYLFVLNPMLAGLSFALYPLLIYILPKLQRRTNNWNKERVDGTRVLSSKINETITGIHEVHGNGSYKIENRKFAKFVQHLFRVRIIWTLYRQGVKVLNNLFQNMGPFILFLVGGYLAIKGRFDLGALVAFLSAYEKIYDPWRELMDFYQIYQDAITRYSKTMDYFDIEPEFKIDPDEVRDPIDLQGVIDVKNLVFEVEGGIRLLNGIDLHLDHGQHLAVVGFSGSGKSTLAQCIGQLYKYTGGNVTLDELEVEDMAKSDVIHNIGIVAQEPFIFDGSIKENLLYGLESDFPADIPRDDSGEVEDKSKLPSLDRMIEVLQQVGIFQDVLRFGLNTVLADDKHELKEKLIAIRTTFQRDHGPDLADYLEFFRENKYLDYSSVAANITFGNPNEERFRLENLPTNEFFLRFLDTAQLKMPLLTLGVELARSTVDILGSLPPDAVFFEQSPIGSEELEEYKELVGQLKKRRLNDLTDSEKQKFLALGLRFQSGVHKMVALPEFLEHMILEAREQFKRLVEEEIPGAFSFYQKSSYIDSQSILDNILFGKAKTEQHQVQDRINQSIVMLLIEEDLLETIAGIGMQFRVGTKGDRLSGGQKQKLAIGRSFIKEPPVLIMDEATSALDNRSQSRIQNLIENKWKGRSTLISVVHRLDIIKNFDKVAVMKAGKIVESGHYDDLMQKKGMLYELVHGNRVQ
ncbi:ABC transporter ATP-binding protein/permease [Oceanidesulfovibrio marinus]|uniref:ABC transporter ATP-binding protein n=1 Tax=Oceanidesulfovibrio marinus TaxID=370038 RepID=A0A6P1ZK92_9BACT|nr:ABC transporter ATP-binding protein/permease [Oceanidesulfovibrio marinus]QJT09891.1 ABC transporter ATP-binding protein [Oceanidesulfovibrio marinus]TVM35992.1 ABC transporter ATP-binding protein [Oceanidesulfovibrio marinus]